MASDPKPDGGGPHLKIIVPTHNRWHEARVSLAHLMRSEYRDFEVVLVEDGCTDGTVEHCRAEFPDVRILHGDGDLWWSGAINLGVEYALSQGAEAVVWLNDDNHMEPGTLTALVESHARNGARTIACARVRQPGEEEWTGEPPPWHPDFKSWSRPEPTPAGDLPVTHPPGGQGVLMPARCLREVGLIDRHAFPHYWADHDFHYRAMRAGYQYFLARDAIIHNQANRPRPESADLFSPRGIRWFLFDRRSAMNLPTLRRLLKRHLPRSQYKATFYPLARRHLLWLTYNWLRRNPLLHKPLSALKRTVSGGKRADSSR